MQTDRFINVDLQMIFLAQKGEDQRYTRFIGRKAHIELLELNMVQVDDQFYDVVGYTPDSNLIMIEQCKPQNLSSFDIDIQCEEYYKEDQQYANGIF
jgi:hypothetical protein